VATIKFPLQEIDISEAIQAFLNENIDELTSALTFSEQDSNDRVEISEVTVSSVRILDNATIEIDYEYEWSFFAGCKDIDKRDTKSETVLARLEGSFIVFDVIERPELRTTVDEF
jgi:hypothetical protein